jgi:hypothetical protein
MMDDFPRDLSWTCHVCGENRPDSAISVAHRPLRGMEDRYPQVRFNARYCNDRIECITVATADGAWPPEGGTT